MAEKFNSIGIRLIVYDLVMDIAQEDKIFVLVAFLR